MIVSADDSQAALESADMFPSFRNGASHPPNHLIRLCNQINLQFHVFFGYFVKTFGLGCDRRSCCKSLDVQLGRVCDPVSQVEKMDCNQIFASGPYFVAFPNLRDALVNREQIKTQARSCTILPNFVG